MLTKRKDGRYVKTITVNGKRVYFYSVEPTQKKAEKDIDRQMMEYKEQEEKGKLFSYVADLWDTQYRKKVSDINYRKNTAAAYNRIVDWFGNIPIKSISVAEVNVFINSLISKGYYKKTVANHKSILNMIFQYAVLNRYIDANPTAEIRLPSNLPKKGREIPSTAEIKTVDMHCEGFDFLPYFLLYTGLRISEALAVQYEDIDFENKIITINKHLLHDGNRPVIENRTKTENSKRTVVLLERLADKIPKNKKGFVFCNEDGTPLTKRQLFCRWKNYQNKYKVTLTAHQLRHAYATMLFEAGVDIKDAQELMGHSDINLTRQIYTHIRETRKEETRKKLNDFAF